MRGAHVECTDCGAWQHVPAVARGEVARCVRCSKRLDSGGGLGHRACLVWTIAALPLLVAGALLPVMRASALGVSRETTLPGAVLTLWRDGWPLLAALFCAYTIVIPPLRALLLGLVLGAVESRRRPPWLGRVFRYALALRAWSMADVVVLAGAVVYLRLAAELSGSIEWGGWCLIGAAALGIVTSRSLAPSIVWRAVMPDRAGPVEEPGLSCYACSLPCGASAEGTPCPRCRKRLCRRRPDASSRTAALVAAGFVLAIASYSFPMSATFRPTGVREHTILSGAQRLFQDGYWYLGVVIVVASIAIPLAKLSGLTWMLYRAHRPSARHAALRTRLYRGIRHIGRWSNMDPFIVALNGSLLALGGFLGSKVGVAALPFALVAALTQIADETFDPRLEWDRLAEQPAASAGVEAIPS